MSTTTRVPRTRLSPEQRRVQLLDLGVQLLAHRSLDELSIDVLAEEAGISRGLLYHYFGNKTEFHEAVVRHAAADLLDKTVPPDGGEPLERLLASVAAYVDYVLENFDGYVSLVRGAAGGNETLRGISEEVRDVLGERVFLEDADFGIVPDNPRNRLLVRGWLAMAEELVISWHQNPSQVTREDLLAMIATALPSWVGGVDAITNAKGA
ncbi:TetR/AcrR family transcriptional regulator [Nocardioides sp.]|uniref:TetR/AcrR family transcriptional regulator n=1 Tax=Nocardioides sp. TaxID=35761 RepID=UPI003569BECC